MDKQTRKFTPGARIILEGETSSEIFILLSGELAVWRGRVELGRLVNHGDVIGELAAFTKRPRAATVVAITAAELLVIPVDLNSFSRKIPDAIEKIDATIIMRYEIARTKARKHSSCAAYHRRSVLHEVLVQNELLRTGKINKPSGDIRKNMRETLDDALALHGDSGDPRILRKIADEYSVLTDYLRECSQKPWLEESIALRLEAIEDRFRLSSSERDIASIRERASVTAEMLDILGEYESTPGMAAQMTRMKLETTVPLDAKIATLRTLVRQKNSELDDHAKIFQERKAILMVEKQKFNAGKDLVMLLGAAEEMGVATEYEIELRQLVALSDSSSSFIDAPPV